MSAARTEEADSGAPILEAQGLTVRFQGEDGAETLDLKQFQLGK